MSEIPLDAYRTWTPNAQMAALDRLRRVGDIAWRPFYCRVPDCNGDPHEGDENWSHNHARGDQHWPADPDWLVWLLLGGRGGGKTRAGSEFTHRMTNVTNRIAIIAATSADVRDVCLEGESGLITVAAPDQRPHYEPSKRRLTWPNGCIGTTFSAEEPDRLRGPEHGFAWLDEPAHYAAIQDVWDNLLLGLRIGKRPRIVATTTPKPRAWLKAIVADPETRVARTSTYANLANLAPTFAKMIVARYEGTRLGRQELHAEILTDVEGALWNYDLIDPYRVPVAPVFDRVVVGVDPAGGSKPSNDETGIIVVGRAGDHLYPLADRTGRYSPYGWAAAVDAAFDEFSADAVIAETNYGGAMVVANLQAAGVPKRVIPVHSRRGKVIRAEPVVGVYEQGKVHHVGVLTDLEEELTTWAPYEDKSSPNRLDALVHAATALLGRNKPGDLASPRSLRRTDSAEQAARLRARRMIEVRR